MYNSGGFPKKNHCEVWREWHFPDFGVRGGERHVFLPACEAFAVPQPASKKSQAAQARLANPGKPSLIGMAGEALRDLEVAAVSTLCF